MKTATFKLNLHTVLFAMMLAAVGCQKEEFAEKDFLENPFAPPEVLDPTTSGSSSGGDTSGGTDGGSTTGSTTAGDTTTGGSTGGVTTGSTDGGTPGTTTGASTGGTTGGTTTSGSTTGDTTGGTTTAGSTTGSSTGGTTTAGSTTGVSTGGTTGGSTTGTATGGTTGGTPAPMWADEQFTQVNTTQRKLDIVWVIDNSGSMSDEQTSLGNNFDLFINDFIDRGVDFKMGITTTDTSGNNAGLAVTNSQSRLTSAAAQANRQQFLTDFKNMVKVGIRGSGNERGLLGSQAYVNRYPNWVRDEAYLIVVYVSDEEDQSPSSAASYLSFLQSTKSAAGYFKAYSIVGMTGCPQASGYSCGYERYDHVSSNSGGSTANITGNFASILMDMGAQIITLIDTFPLSHDVMPGTMEVRFDGVVQATGWEVDGRQLKIHAGSVPAAGTQITVRYQYQ